jgi:hypothetical protein
MNGGVGTRKIPLCKSGFNHNIGMLGNVAPILRKSAPVAALVSHWAGSRDFFHTPHELTALFWPAGLEGFDFCFALCARFAGERLAAQWVRQQELPITYKVRFTI